MVRSACVLSRLWVIAFAMALCLNQAAGARAQDSVFMIDLKNGIAAQNAGDREGAVYWFRETIAAGLRLAPDEDLGIISVRIRLAQALAAAERCSEANEGLQSLLPAIDRLAPAPQSDGYYDYVRIYLDARVVLGSSRACLGDLPGAVAILEQGRRDAMDRFKLPPSDPDVSRFDLTLGAAYLLYADLDRAESVLLRIVDPPNASTAPDQRLQALKMLRTIMVRKRDPRLEAIDRRLSDEIMAGVYTRDPR